MIEVEEERICNPTYELLMYLNKYEEERLDNEKLQFLLKNIQTHFKKLLYTVCFINKIQKDEAAIKKYDQTSIVSIQNIEYCYYKISTIWDVSFQIADELIFPKKKGKDKYSYLEERFKDYEKNLTSLKIEWYRKFNVIRNRIVHGGITVNPFYINDKNVKHRICFQAYDFNLNDMVEQNYYYSNIYNNNINYADNYFTMYTHVLYSYLTDFFRFVLLEISKDSNNDIEDLSLEDDVLDQCKKSKETWLLSDLDIFKDITDAMITLRLNEGVIVKNSTISRARIEENYNQFPFIMMKNISAGGWVLHV